MALIEHAAPPPAPAPWTPQRRAFAREWPTLVQPARHVVRRSVLRDAARGGGAPVVVIPGWRSPELAMEPLRAWLARRGFDARHWGFGVNGGQPEVDAERLARVVDARARADGRPIGLVGWSLGGVIAREVARAVPHAVSSVVTYGTPVIGGPTYTIAATAWTPEKRAYVAQKIAELDVGSPIARPIRAVFTRRDGIVAWPACLDRSSPDVVHYEADSGHFGMGIDPDVWRLAADTLAAHRG